MKTLILAIAIVITALLLVKPNEFEKAQKEVKHAAASAMAAASTVAEEVKDRVK